MCSVWVLIPARAGSKGVPGKNVRPLADKPLVSYVLDTVCSVFDSEHVLVSTDDSQVEALCGCRATIVRRPQELAADATTLDEVAVSVARGLLSDGAKSDDILLTVQPTSPFLSAETLLKSVEMIRGGLESVLTVVDDRHLRWTMEDAKARPLFVERVNRQWLQPQLAETGGIIGARLKKIVDAGTRVVEPVGLLEVSQVEGVDIDDFADWAVAEFYATRRTILIRADAGSSLGMGHVYRALALNHELARHDVHVVTRFDPERELGPDFLRERLGAIEVVEDEDQFFEILDAVRPDVAILDILDTTGDYMSAVKERCGSVVSIEDIGPGSRFADLIVNDLYTDPYPSGNHLYGVQYAILGPHFEGIDPIETPTESVERILVSFGGTDPGRLTGKALEALALADFRGEVIAVLGPGYSHGSVSLDEYGLNGEVLCSVTNLATVMHECDLAITSAGRTVTELMTQGVPTIALCQNLREMSHSHASSPFGVANLGLGEYVEANALAQHVSLLIGNTETRVSMHDRMLKSIRGRSNRVVADTILSMIDRETGQSRE